MLPAQKLELVHLQLTRSCNLRCWFCGQWGHKGFFSNTSGSNLSFEDWRRVIDSLRRHREQTGESPDIMLWGGEPLVSPDFLQITEYLKKYNFTLGMVTNGVLLDRYMDVCKESFEKIYVSIDGNREIHDKIRGNGVFDRVFSNLNTLRSGNAKIVIMTVLSPDVLDILPELPRLLSPLQPDEMLLQEMIVMTAQETKSYANWLQTGFSMPAPGIDAWQTGSPTDFEARKATALKKVLQEAFPFPVTYLPHGKSAGQSFCLSPFRHLHVAWNGNVLYCTDFYDFSAGNVKNADIIDIFYNELSDRFRREIAANHCPSCSHCAWKNNTCYYIT